jgi:hypothetical protein
MDTGNPEAVKLVGELKGLVSFDVITLGGYALVSAADGLYIVDYTNPSNPRITSSVKILKP